MKYLSKIIAITLIYVSTVYSLNAHSFGSVDPKEWPDHLGLWAAIYTMWDLDHDRILSDEEWREALNIYVGEQPDGLMDLSQFDANGDAKLDMNEFRRVMRTWDQESMTTLMKGEPDLYKNARLFEIWSLDDDPKIEKLRIGELVIELDEDHN